MSNLKKTLEDIKKTNIGFVLTRFDRESSVHDDLDILVRPKDFDRIEKSLNGLGYESVSHDQALGGRIKGAQRNLIKDKRIKIDLHKDFTWRADRYLDLNIIWKNFEQKNIDGINVKMPSSEIDAFLVIINVIFEKTYITRDEHNKIWPFLDKIKVNKKLQNQAESYGWDITLDKFLDWTDKNSEIRKFPVFLPFSLVMLSYFEKLSKRRVFHLKSFLYYSFFRARYLFNKTLPYD